MVARTSAQDSFLGGLLLLYPILVQPAVVDPPQVHFTFRRRCSFPASCRCCSDALRTYSVFRGASAVCAKRGWKQAVFTHERRAKGEPQVWRAEGGLWYRFLAGSRGDARRFQELLFSGGFRVPSLMPMRYHGAREGGREETRVLSSLPMQERVPPSSPHQEKNGRDLLHF